MYKWVKNVVKLSEMLDWEVSIDGNEFTFSKYSPEGQDFNFCVTADSREELLEKLAEYHENYDVSEETYIWLDSTGHGTNGAPYDMKDVYEDMEACKDMVSELHMALS
jgi:hypothetical protein